MYFITTVNPSINVKRVEARIRLGGHGIDAAKIVTRYRRVMEEVLSAILPMVDEAILFDNSSALDGAVAVLALQDGKLKSLADDAMMPAWASALLP